MPTQSPTQLNNALNPTPYSVSIPGGVFTDSGGQFLYQRDPTTGKINSTPTNQFDPSGAGNVTKGWDYLKDTYGYGLNAGSYANGTKQTQVLNQVNIADLQKYLNDSQGNIYGNQVKSSDFFAAAPNASPQGTALNYNTTPNTLSTAPAGSPPTPMQAQATAAQTQQLAGDQGQNVQTTLDAQGNITRETKTPLAQGAPTINPASGLPQLPPAQAGTSTGAAGIDQNYQLQPGESIDAYNARIAAYNAATPTTIPSGTIGASGTMGSTTGQPNDPYAGLDPISKQVKMYTDAYNQLGLSTIKQQFDQYAKQQSDLQNELSDKKQANQNNPWLSQGLVDKMNSQLDTKYQARLDTLTHLLTLTDSLYKQGTAQVDHMVSDANADIKATNDLAQKQIDAANALAKDNIVVTEQAPDGSYHDYLMNKATSKVVSDLGVTKPSSAPSLADKETLAAFTAALRQGSGGTGNYGDVKAQNALEQQYRTALEKELSNRSGGLGLQDAKVNQAIHLKALFSQYKDANGNYNIPQAQYAEVAMGLANLVSGTNQVSDSAREAILQRTAAGDFKGAITYITGTPQNGNTQAVFKNLVDSIDRQGQVAQELRDQYIGFLHGLAPTGLDPSRIQALESHGLASYDNPPNANGGSIPISSLDIPNNNTSGINWGSINLK